MIEALACGLTLTAVCAASVLGYRMGARRILLRAWPIVLGWAAGILTALVGLWAGWFWPFGLVTPVFLALVAGVAARQIARRRLESLLSRSRSAGRAGRAAGALLGAGGGAAAAAFLWLGAALANAALMSPVSNATVVVDPGGGAVANPLQALIQTANRGFVRHLPLVGPWGDEVEALTVILNTDGRVRAQLAHEAGWEKLSELPSLRAIVHDGATLQDIDRVGEGELLALYRLQKNPLVLDFFAEAEVQKLLLEARPTTLARQLAAIEARSRRRAGR